MRRPTAPIRARSAPTATPVVEKHAVVGAQTQYVLRNIVSVVRSAKWANVCGLSVRAGEPHEPDAAHLALVVVEGFDPPGLFGIPHDARYGGYLPGRRRVRASLLRDRPLRVRRVGKLDEPVAPDQEPRSTPLLPVILDQI